MNYYAKAIDIITTHRSASEEILREIAKQYPDIVVKGFEAFLGDTWKEEVISLLMAKKKIQAIERYRELTGIGLDYVKSICKTLEYSTKECS